MFEPPNPPKALPFMIYGAAIGMLLFSLFKLGQASVEPVIEYVEVPIINAPTTPVKVRPTEYITNVAECPPSIIVQEPPKRLDK